MREELFAASSRGRLSEDPEIDMVRNPVKLDEILFSVITRGRAIIC